MTIFLFSNFAESRLSAKARADDFVLKIAASDAEKFPVPQSEDERFAAILYDGVQAPEVVWGRANPLNGNITVERAKENSTAKEWPAGTAFVHTLTSQSIEWFTTGGQIDWINALIAEDLRLQGEINLLSQRVDGLEATIGSYQINVMEQIGQTYAAVVENATAFASLTEAWATYQLSVAAEIGANSALVNSLNSAFADLEEAVGTSIDQISARVGDAEADIIEERQARSSFESAQTSLNLTLTARLDDAESAIQNEQLTRVTQFDAMAQTLATISANIAGVSASVSQESYARASEFEAVAGTISDIRADFEAADQMLAGWIEDEAEARANALEAVAEQFTTYGARIAGNPNWLLNSTATQALEYGWGTPNGWVRFEDEDGTGFEFVGTGGNAIMYSDYYEIPNLGGSKVSVGVDTKLSGHTAGTSRVRIDFWDATTQLETVLVNSDGSDHDWRRSVLEDYTAPAGATRFRVRLQIGSLNAGAVARVRKIKVEPGSLSTIWNDDATGAAVQSTITVLASTYASLAGNAESRYAVSLDADGVFTGFQLLAGTNPAGTTVSEFKVWTENFILSTPDGLFTPFYFDVEEGFAYLQNVVVDWAWIDNVVVQTGDIEDLAVSNAKIGNGAITKAKIGDLEVDTIKIANAAVTNQITAYSATGGALTGTTRKTLKQVIIPTNGGRCVIEANFHLYTENSPSYTVLIQILREPGPVIVYQVTLTSPIAGADFFGLQPIMFVDNPPAGTYTYSLRVTLSRDDMTSQSYSNPYLSVMEILK